MIKLARDNSISSVNILPLDSPLIDYGDIDVGAEAVHDVDLVN